MKLKKSDDQTNIDKYRIAANIMIHLTISKLFFLRLIIPKFKRYVDQKYKVDHINKQANHNF